MSSVKRLSWFSSSTGEAPQQTQAQFHSRGGDFSPEQLHQEAMLTQVTDYQRDVAL